MKKKMSVGILAIFLLALPLVCFGQDATTGASPKYGEQSLQLTIKSDKEVYEGGEEVKIDCRLTNNSKTSQKILTYSNIFEFPFGNPFSVQDSEDKEASFIGAMKQRPKPTEKDYIIVKPGEVVNSTYRLDLFYDMKKPSVYSIKCNKWQLDMISNVGITSNTISIEVVDKKETVRSTSSVNPGDWGPAYVSGMEYGPASKEHSIAMGKAESFMVQQSFAGQYAKRACAVSGSKSDIFEVSFALLSDKTGRPRGIVRVNMKNGECSWLGIKRN